MSELTCFTAYDIRGRLGDELNEEIAYRIGRAYGEYIKPKSVVVGGDVRLTSESLKLALANGLMDAGVDVIDLGMTGTEEIYFATWYLGVDGGVEVTASHNPMDCNGMKLVRENAKPISGDTGLNDIQRIAEENNFGEVRQRGCITQQSTLDAYVDHLFSYIDTKGFKPLKLVVNPGNGAAGHIIDAIEERLDSVNVPIEFIKLQHQPDGNFPNGIPNPLLPERRQDTTEAVIKHKANMGIAWDGDFDRCFLFDEKGKFIEGYYIVGLLAEAILEKNPGSKIIHDPRLTWNTIDVVKRCGGYPVQSKTGHAFIKERMRVEDAAYGGEMSAHHYFRDFAYCDSGMIPWLLISELMSEKGKPLSELVAEMIAAYPSSGEINIALSDVDSALDSVRNKYSSVTMDIDETDGISMDMGGWRFNLRSSNTEPLVRLNVESRSDEKLVRMKTEEILMVLKTFE